jgi:NADPH-dependent ferric siderophore reductase
MSQPENSSRTAPRKVIHPLRIRRLKVARIEPLGPRRSRVVLTGPDLRGFRALAPRDHLRVFFPGPDGVVTLPRIVDGRWTDRGNPQLLHRDYTVRHYDEQRQELWLDMDLHEGGLASRWAIDAGPGDELGILGPRMSLLDVNSADWYLFAVDTTALPALERWLADLRPETPVTVFIEVTDDADRVPLASAATLDVHWLARDDDAGAGAVLERALADFLLPAQGQGRIWAAGEAGTMSRIRRDLLDRVDRDRVRVMAEGYWKQGVSDYDHHGELPPPDPRG